MSEKVTLGKGKRGLYNLTPSERRFADAYLENPNRMEAFRKSHPHITNHQSQLSYAHRLYHSHAVRDYIQRRCAMDELHVDAYEALKGGLQAKTDKGNPDHSVRLAAFDKYAKLNDIYPRESKFNTREDLAEAPDLSAYTVSELAWIAKEGRLPDSRERKRINAVVTEADEVKENLLADRNES